VLWRGLVLGGAMYERRGALVLARLTWPSARLTWPLARARAHWLGAAEPIVDKGFLGGRCGVV